VMVGDPWDPCGRAARLAGRVLNTFVEPLLEKSLRVIYYVGE
jgi:hypothetical protein